MLLAILQRDLKSVLRDPSVAIQPLIFYIITTTLFPLAVTPDPSILRTMAPGIIWVSALLATLLALDNLFKSDFEDGTMDQLVIFADSLQLVSLAKILSHWLITGLPLLLACLLTGTMLNIPGEAVDALMISLLLGTPTLSMVGSIGAALTLGLKFNGILLTLIVMPLYIPVLIFGTSCVNAAILGLEWSAQVYMLGALLVLSLILAPFATAAALKINLG